MRRVLIIVAIFLIPVIPIVLVVTGVLKSAPQKATPVTLTIWGTDTDTAGVNAVIEKYRATRPYATISYVTVRPEDYAKQLVSAWAQGTGPDIYFVPSSWIGAMSQYSLPMPADLTVPQVVTSKNLLGKTSKVIVNAKPAPSVATLRNQFVDAVVSDVIRDGQTWGLPVSMDTLVLYYNKALTNNAKIFEPAATWSALQTQVTTNRLTIVDEQGHLVQSGVALGTALNLPYANDLLTLLMMQNGSIMTTSDRKASLSDDAGMQALKFYLSFAQLNKSNYSWDEQQTNARDAFIQGKVAYYFGTWADRSLIAASTLNWGVSSMLHVRPTGDNDGTTNTERFIDAARYNVAMVAKATTTTGRSVQAWNFVEYMSQPGNASYYLQATGRLPAVRSLLSAQSDNPDSGVFVKQMLTAKSWYHGNDGPAVDEYLQKLITNALSGKTDLVELLNLANSQIQSTL
jgi:ABC-type glycerol-3-phosphate transport system substrate-binding protein